MIIHSLRPQQGVALVVSLIILVSLTLLGLSSMRRTTVDLAMAANEREIGLMFQSAEMGLITAEDYIQASTSNADFDNAPLGLYTVRAQDPTYRSPGYFNASGWTAASQTAATSLEVYEQPRYKIEYLGDRSQNPLAAIGIGGYGAQQTGDVVSIYRSTSRGAGLTGNSYRYLQSYYGKDKP
ncbi:MAG TPA: PilX N-terminal domain-containing pilus assembly protein [Gammaproteobacteria bacterium]